MPNSLQGSSSFRALGVGGGNMEFRRSGHSDDRRRRVLLDESSVPETGAAEEPPGRQDVEAPTTEPARRYTEAARAYRQPRVIDLIPTRRWTNLVLGGLLLACLAGCEAIYGYVAVGRAGRDMALLPAIDLATRGSAATWLSAVLLAASAIMGVLIHQIRRHRVDDYRGRYRMWCWVVPLLLLASIDQVAGLQDTVHRALLLTAGIPESPRAALIAVASLALVTTALGGRLMMEMRACYLAIVLLGIGLACLALVGAAQLGWVLAERGVFRTMVVAGLTLGAHIAFFLSLCWYGRHVHRDAHEQVPVASPRARTKVRKPQRAKEVGARVAGEAASGSPLERPAGKIGKVRRVDSPHTTDAAPMTPSRTPSGPLPVPGEEKRRVVARPVAAERAASGPLCEPDDDQVADRALSKAERKRLRKQRREERPT